MFVEKWKSVVKNTTKFPTEIISLIFDLTIIPPKKQFIERYYADENINTRGNWIVDCYCSWKYDDKTRKLKERTCGTKVRVGRSGDRHGFEACHLCDTIDFCQLANVDTDICVLDQQCSLCSTKICKHYVHDKFVNPRMITRWSEKAMSTHGFHPTPLTFHNYLCVDCGKYSLFGRRVFENIVKEEPATYDDFMKLILQLAQ
jgi:hypothetical protein